MTAIQFNVHFEINYEGWNYIFEPEKTVKVEDDVLGFLADRVPLSFEIQEVKDLDKVPKATRTKTIAWTRPKRGVFGGEVTNRNMAVFGRPNHEGLPAPDVTPRGGSIDTDGVEWYGEGETRSKS